MPKREFALVIDVETCGDLKKPLVYDLGFAVIERRSGKIVESASLVIGETFFAHADAMRTAYYADKLPIYREGMANGKFVTVPMWVAWRKVRDVIRKYNIKRAYAYNMDFDQRALNHTIKIHSNGRYNSFLPAGIEYCCIMHMACQTILSQRKYGIFARANGFVSPAGNVRTTAEAAYAYITNNPAYQEPHTGLEDVKIEIGIMQKCIRQKKRMVEKPRRDAWKIPQAKARGQLQMA